jgi:MATE family multidrug resistance protein
MSSSSDDRAERAELLKLAGPIALTHLAQMGVGLTDTVMLGRYGETALAASVLGATVYLFCWLVGMGPAAATSPMIAQVQGAHPRDRARTRAIVRMGLWAVGLAALPLDAILFAAGPILRALGQSPALAADASRFVVPLAFGLPFALGFQVLRNFAVALGRPRLAVYVMAATLLVNALGDYALIFGRLGAPRLGLVGSGVASALAFAFSFAALAAAIAVTPDLRAFRLARRFARPHWDRLAEIAGLGLPLAAAHVLESGFYLVAHLMVGLFGPTVVAAHAIAWSLQNLTTPAPTGFGMAATVRVGLAAGAGDAARARRAGAAALAATVACMAVFGGLMAALAAPLAGLFLGAGPQRAAVITAAVPLIWVAAAYQVADGVQAAAAFALRGLKDVRAPLRIMAAGFWLVGLPACLILAFAAGLHALGVWLRMALALAVTAALLGARFLRLSAHSANEKPPFTG